MMKTWTHALFTLFLLSSSLAHASLGGDDQSIQTDVGKLGTTRTVTQYGQYSRSEFGAHGALVHEFTAPNGEVFAIAWKGKSHPDLSVLLGSQMSAFKQTLAQARKTHHGHGPLSVEVGNLHIEMGGHMMAVQGRIWLIKSLPQGVDKNEIQ